MSAVYLAALDSEGQVVRSLNSGQAELSFVEILPSDSNRNESEFTHFFSLRSNQEWATGAYKLENVTLVGEPGRDYLLTLGASQVLDNSKPDVQEALTKFEKIEPSIRVHFRVCETGEAFLKTGECQVCDSHSFSLEAPTEPTECLSCPRNAVCFGGDKIGPAPGLWREDEKSLSFLSCFNPAACLGSFEDNPE